MTTSIKYFNRYELKYVINQAQQSQIVESLSPYMEADRQDERGGGYLVTSLYYDSLDYKAYWDKIEGHRFRRKLRIRAYGDERVTDASQLFVEIKQRVNKTLQKKRLILSYEAAKQLCGAGRLPDDLAAEDRSLAEEICYLSKTLNLRPTCLVAYRRLAFNGTDYDPGLRITFDSQLKSRTHDLTLSSLTYTKNSYFVPPQWIVMEVKVNNRVPYWVTQLLGKHGCTLRRVGKYCTALEEARLPHYQPRVTLAKSLQTA